jgi:hypothetical protein
MGNTAGWKIFYIKQGNYLMNDGEYGHLQASYFGVYLS